ncbi:AAA family ATPase [Vibrio sp. OPT18]|uniref:AAA family ATPase n=1 Tax=Vibrio sp. OPT18 TaxID=2778641 RepID=UPI001882AFD2|nr:AAA family ATPase [Vibrio sp. OPT18]MBE8575609.1 AAA family ATPase [Vibrio sp. OPT18]
MKLLRFEAKAVHDYLDFNVDFRPDVNFFAGLNGSGKTTALKMIMAMLTPSLEQLREIEFSVSRLVIEDKNRIINIAYRKTEEGLLITLDGHRDDHNQDLIPWEFLESPKSRHRWDREQSETLRNISKITTPIFLSLDRRFIKSSLDDEFISSIKYSNEEVRYFRNEMHHRAAKRIKTGDVSVDEVVAMIHEASLRAKNVQSRADKKLRDNIILDSLVFGEADVRAQFPTRTTLRELQSKQMMIRKTLDNLDVSNKALEKRFDAFFFKLESIVNKIERFAGIEKSAFEREIVDEDFQEAMSEWVINQNQLKRIDRLFDLVQKYQIEKRGIYKDLNRLEGLVNKFLNETGKSIHINQLGQIKIRIGNTERDLSVLSSGERQILIMFVHLVLDKKLKGGIFIIDEPELSLHISWQDMFVDAVLEANPNLQLVLATHSPSIIGGRNHMYVPLNGGH